MKTWYSPKSMSKRTFAGFLNDICNAAGLKTRYTAHCLRATAIQHLSDKGYAARHIMFMSSHKSEASLKSYSRTVSANQKRDLSDSLAGVLEVESAVNTRCPPPTPRVLENALCTVTQNNKQPIQSQSQTQSVTVDERNTLNPGIFAGSIFNNCTFNFNQ